MPAHTDVVNSDIVSFRPADGNLFLPILLHGDDEDTDFPLLLFLLDGLNYDAWLLGFFEGEEIDLRLDIVATQLAF